MISKVMSLPSVVFITTLFLSIEVIGPHQLVIVAGVRHRDGGNEQAQRQNREKEVASCTVDYQKGARAFSRTCSAVQPDARRSRTPVSPSDLLSFCAGDFMTSA